MASEQPVSPHYVAVTTPHIKDDLNIEPTKAEVVDTAPVMGCTEKCFEIGKVSSYMIGSILFMIGSILFYPSLATAFNSQAATIGAWLFSVGCLFFLLGTNGDFIDAIRFLDGSRTRRIATIYNAATYVFAAAIFQLGAIYFVPQVYALNASLGCWCFIVGCAMFDVAAINDCIFLVTSHDDPKQKGVDLRKLKSWTTVASFGTLVGATLFIIGSYFYLPKYISMTDAVVATANMNRSINCFVIGCVFFILNAAAMIPGLLDTIRVTPPCLNTKKASEFV